MIITSLRCISSHNNLNLHQIIVSTLMDVEKYTRIISLPRWQLLLSPIKYFYWIDESHGIDRTGTEFDAHALIN